MNKYLVKIAETTNSDNQDLKVVGGVGATAIGGGIIKKQFSDGNLTGRETLYHGTSADRASGIRKTGLTPNKSGVSQVISDNLHNRNKNLVFATKDRAQAAGYAVQQDAINSGKIHSVETLKAFQENLEHKLGIVKNIFNKDKIVKINAPTWKDDYKKIINPEFRGGVRAINKNPLIGLMHPNPGPNKINIKRKYGAVLQKSVHTIRNEKGIPTDFIHGAAGYKPNTLSEIREFAKVKPNRFLKGVGKAIGGAALIGTGLYSVYHRNDKRE